MNLGTVLIEIASDARQARRALWLLEWRLARFGAQALHGNERRRQVRLLAVDREFGDILDTQLVTMSDGVCRVVSKPVGGWC